MQQCQPAKNPEAKWMRFQEIGLSHWLALSPSLVLAEMYGLSAWYALIIVLLLVFGWVFFFIGLVGRQELAAKQAQDRNNPDCPKCLK